MTLVLGLLALGRVVPDLSRIAHPLGIFPYVTDRLGVVRRVAKPERGSDAVRLGDRVRIDRIRPYDRKPGFLGTAFSYENKRRNLPIERRGRERTLWLIARDEPATSRITVVVRILVFVSAVALGALLFLVAPSIETAALYAYTLGADFPATYLDLLLPNPWRQGSSLLGALFAGASPPALLTFAITFVTVGRPRRAWLAIVGTVAAVTLGALNAYGFWRAVYAAEPIPSLADLYDGASRACGALTIVVLLAAIAVARTARRRRIASVAIAFTIATLADLASRLLYPHFLPSWVHAMLLTLTVLPIGVVWIAVVRNRFFNVDFVVSRAVVYAALTAAVLGTISIIEEIGTLIFVNKSDLAYGILIAITMAVGAVTGTFRTPIERAVDRFVFPNRRAQRKALQYIAGYIVDATSRDDVYRALVADTVHALELAYAGIFEREHDGQFVLATHANWPPGGVRAIPATSELLRTIASRRSGLSLHGDGAQILRAAFGTDRVNVVAPIFVGRDIDAFVAFGRNVGGLDLDPDERELLTTVIANASIARTAIELTSLRQRTRTCSVETTER